jgi:hypothetical protein
MPRHPLGLARTSTAARPIIDGCVSPRRDAGAARCSLTRALSTTNVIPMEFTAATAAYPHVVDELAGRAWHWTQAYANNRIKSITGSSRVGCDRCAA